MLDKYQWVCTDLDNNQYRRTLSNTRFIFKEDRIVNPETEEVITYESEIDLDSYSQEEIKSCLSSYGYNEYDTNKFCDCEGNFIDNSLIAECLFEMEN